MEIKLNLCFSLIKKIKIMYQNKFIELLSSKKHLRLILDNDMNFVLQSREVLSKMSKLNGIFMLLSIVCLIRHLYNIFIHWFIL